MRLEAASRAYPDRASDPALRWAPGTVETPSIGFRMADRRQPSSAAAPGRMAKAQRSAGSIGEQTGKHGEWIGPWRIPHARMCSNTQISTRSARIMPASHPPVITLSLLAQASTDWHRKIAKQSSPRPRSGAAASAIAHTAPTRSHDCCGNAPFAGISWPRPHDGKSRSGLFARANLRASASSLRPACAAVRTRARSARRGRRGRCAARGPNSIPTDRAEIDRGGAGWGKETLVAAISDISLHFRGPLQNLCLSATKDRGHVLCQRSGRPAGLAHAIFGTGPMPTPRDRKNSPASPARRLRPGGLTDD